MSDDATKVHLALNRLKLLEDYIRDGKPLDLHDFCLNMRLRLEHGVPGDTIACFASGNDDGVPSPMAKVADALRLKAEAERVAPGHHWVRLPDGTMTLRKDEP